MRSVAGGMGVASFEGELHDVSVDGSGLSVRLKSSTGPFVGADVSLSSQNMHVHARVAYILLEGGQVRMGVSVGGAGQARVRAMLATHERRMAGCWEAGQGRGYNRADGQRTAGRASTWR